MSFVLITTMKFNKECGLFIYSKRTCLNALNQDIAMIS